MTRVVVVGGGHNGLVCAAYLARAGLDVTVLEAGSATGGCAATVDALDGARVNICNCDHTMVRTTAIADELDLAAHGLRYLDVDPQALHVGWDDAAGPAFVQFRDVERTLAALAVTHPTQVDGYRRYLADATPVARLLVELTATPPTPGRVLRKLADRKALALPRLLDWSRRSVADVLGRYLTDPFLVAGAFTTGPAVWGVAPSTPGTGLGATGIAMRHLVGIGRPVGGSGALPAALQAALEAAGGRVRTGARVARVLVDGRGSAGSCCPTARRCPPTSWSARSTRGPRSWTGSGRTHPPAPGRWSPGGPRIGSPTGTSPSSTPSSAPCRCCRRCSGCRSGSGRSTRTCPRRRSRRPWPRSRPRTPRCRPAWSHRGRWRW
ncbi:phytoene desaturase family protein [Klenkia terrae]|uniref:NAD(P)/FAD-dependent oxidoreductase n=1 Tax=Klenkia terrae TaxID=1052259 RepID=A0ABU8E4M5_9ACTN|nr:NAD(P)/FAD-dependent oxidoreductase [Klenkia terrae]